MSMVLASLNGKFQDAHVHFLPPQLSKFPRFGRPDRGRTNLVTGSEQVHSG